MFLNLEYFLWNCSICQQFPLFPLCFKIISNTIDSGKGLRLIDLSSYVTNKICNFSLIVPQCFQKLSSLCCKGGLCFLILGLCCFALSSFLPHIQVNSERRYYHGNDWNFYSRLSDYLHYVDLYQFKPFYLLNSLARNYWKFWRDKILWWE